LADGHSGTALAAMAKAVDLWRKEIRHSSRQLAGRVFDICGVCVSNFDTTMPIRIVSKFLPKKSAVYVARVFLTKVNPTYSQRQFMDVNLRES
jgi:hypothetical protein